jgi:hypothetical protein
MLRLCASMQLDVADLPLRQYERAVRAFADADPAKSSSALACVYLPEDAIEAMRDEVRFSTALC